MIVYTPKKGKPANRTEEPIDRETVVLEGIACPFCEGTKDLTSKKVPTIDERLIYCGRCGANFWENEGGAV